MSILAGGLLVFAFIIAAVIVGFFWSRAGRRPRSVLLASLEGRWNGRVHEGGILSGDRLDISVDGVAGEVTFGENPEPNWQSAVWTRVRFNWPSERRLRVAPEDFVSKIRHLFGGTDIEFDDPAFDDRFRVESSHPVWARGLLDPATRRSFIKLQWSPKGPFSDQLTLDVGPAGVSMRVSRVLVDNAEALGSFIETCIAILQKSRGLADASGVVLEPARSLEGSDCPVCGQAVADEALPCPTCRTPHHGDCWRYFGGCAIFGCTTRMRKP